MSRAGKRRLGFGKGLIGMKRVSTECWLIWILG
jgi:hypothetical protein